MGPPQHMLPTPNTGLREQCCPPQTGPPQTVLPTPNTGHRKSCCQPQTGTTATNAVSYTHLRAHETRRHL
eukprot:264915-Prorocentrum_lima.AAC.1